MNHLLYWIERESPEQMIQRFRLLFLEDTRYPEPDVVQALNCIVASSSAQESFTYFLNRCCHILINRWQARSQFQLAIPLLLELFESVIDSSSTSESFRLVRRSLSNRRFTNPCNCISADRSICCVVAVSKCSQLVCSKLCDTQS